MSEEIMENTLRKLDLFEKSLTFYRFICWFLYHII